MYLHFTAIYHIHCCIDWQDLQLFLNESDFLFKKNKIKVNMPVIVKL